MTSFRLVRTAVAVTRLGVGDGLGERLFHEHVGAGLHRLDGVVGVGVGHRVDRHHVGLQLAPSASSNEVNGPRRRARPAARASRFRARRRPATSNPSMRE